MTTALKLADQDDGRRVSFAGADERSRRQPDRRPRPVRATSSPFVAFAAVGLVLVVLGLGLVAQRVQVMALTYELDEVKARLERVEQQHGRLQVQVAGARSLARIETEARERLGMVDADARPMVVFAPTPAAVPADVDVLPGNDGLLPALAALGNWVHERFQSPAEAGERR